MCNKKYVEKLLIYLNNDVDILQKILAKYMSIYQNLVGSFEAYTIPSLALILFRKKYLRLSIINKLTPGIDALIREAFLGGICDIFRPTAEEDQKIYYYDINSLYPYVMRKYNFPTGKPVYFKGTDIKLTGDTIFFGFFKCYVETPENMYIPLISIKTDEGLKQPLGKFEAFLFSEEALFAMEHGYKITPIYGYSFTPAKLFDDYVETLSKERLKYNKGDCVNVVVKLLLNSLYGKFGMHMEHTITEIISHDQIKDYIKYYKLLFCEPLNKDENSDKFIISYEKGINYEVLENSLKNGLITIDEYKKFESNTKYDLSLCNTAVHIAAAITAYARIEINKYKLMYQKYLLYSDTDSLLLTIPLESSLVSATELGKFKLEGIYDKAYFIAAKCYSLFDYKNKEVKIVMKGLSKDTKNKYKVFLENENF